MQDQRKKNRLIVEIIILRNQAASEIFTRIYI